MYITGMVGIDETFEFCIILGITLLLVKVGKILRTLDEIKKCFPQKQESKKDDFWQRYQNTKPK